MDQNSELRAFLQGLGRREVPPKVLHTPLIPGRFSSGLHSCVVGQ